MVTAYGYVGTCGPLHSNLHPYCICPQEPSHGKLRSMLTGTGVGSNFRFVSDLELKPAQNVRVRVEARGGGAGRAGVRSARIIY